MIKSFASFPSALSIFRSRKDAMLLTELDDEDLFVDCRNKQVDVFHFLERDDTTVSYDEDDSYLEECETSSWCSEGSTVYFDAFDALDESLLLFEKEETAEEVDDDELDRIRIVDSEDDDASGSSTNIEVELSERFELSRDFGKDNNDDDEKERDDGNPLSHAVHLAQHVWEGSKQTPVGLVIHVTEGVFAHVMGMIHHDKDNEEEKEQQGRKADEDSNVELSVPSPARPVDVEVSPLIKAQEASPLLMRTHPETPLVKELQRRLELTPSMEPRIYHDMAYENRNGLCVSLAPSEDDDWLPLE